MARTKDVKVNGTDFKLQSVPYSWYVGLTDKYLTANRRDSVKFMDALLKACVTFPVEVAKKGISFFDDMDDFSTPEELIREIDTFLKEPPQPAGS